MAGRQPKLSWWEIAEAYVDARNGVSVQQLANYYGLKNFKTLLGYFRRFEDEARARGYRVKPVEFNTMLDSDSKYGVEYPIAFNLKVLADECGDE